MCGDGNSLIQDKVVSCSKENKVLRKQEWAQGHNERKGWFLPHDGRGGKMWAQKITLVGLIVVQSWKLKQLWRCDLA